MSLTGRERRAWQAIAGELHAQDPALAELLSASSKSVECVVVRRTAWAFVWVSALMLVLGLLLGDLSLMAAGGLLLICFPLVCLIFKLRYRDRNSGPG